MYFLALYKEISGEYIENHDIEIAKKALNIILGQDVEAFLIEVKQLSYRKPVVDEKIEVSP